MPDPYEQQVEAIARSISREVDAEILAVMQAQVALETGPGPLTRAHLESLREELDRWPLQATQAPMMNQQDWEDIVGWSNSPETPNLNGDVFLTAGSAEPGSGGSVTITGGTGASASGQGGAVTITGGSARRVVIPQFEIISSPTFRVEDIRSRRFNLIERTSTSLVKADDILNAVLRVKAPLWELRQVTSEYPVKTIWELLIEWAE